MPWWRRPRFRRVVPERVRSRLWYRELERQIDQAARQRDYDLMRELQEDMRFAQQGDEEERALGETSRLLTLARRFHVRTPPVWLDDAGRERSPYWTDRGYGAPLYMTPRGMEWARARIRREERWRRQQRIHFVTVVGTLLGAVTGLLAAATALAAVTYR